MCDSNVISDDCKLCFTERRQSLTVIGEYCPSKIDNDRSLMSENPLNSSPCFNDFRTASSEKQSSNICPRPKSIQQEDFSGKVNTSPFASEDTAKKLAAKSENRSYLEKSSKHDGHELKNIEDVFEVIGKGTKLMKKMNFPTVIVKNILGSFEKSRVYHIILELRTEEFTENIPAVMFSSPYAHRRTKFGELLPLRIIRNSKSFHLTPLLQKKRFRRVFRKGCSLKIKMFTPGRVLDDRGHCWSRYDHSRLATQNLLKEVIVLDIRRLCSHIFHTAIPVKHRNKSSKRMQRNKTRLQRKSNETWLVNLKAEEIPTESFDRTYTPFRINSKPLKQGNKKGKSKALFSKSQSTLIMKVGEDI